MQTWNKKLYKSRENKVLAGVLGGLGEYMGVDPVLLRVAYIALSVFSAVFPGIICYILMAIVIPNRPETVNEQAREANTATN